jgi:rod shape-determining protein MreC
VELRRQNAFLREQLGLAQAIPLPRIAAGVIAKDHDNLFSTITINKGYRHGIQVDMPVVAFQEEMEGLVGRVVAVGPGTSQVLPLYDPSCQVSARLDESRFEGLASGQGSDRATLLMRYVKKIAADRIEYGGLVVTAGLGGLYPAGINVGRVRDIRAETYETSLTLEIEPVIDFDRLEYVFALGRAPERPAAAPAGGPAAAPATGSGSP